MGIKFIAIDIDGTLITPDKRITTPVREALKYAERKGVMVSLITGRLYPTCKKYSLELGISGPCIIYQGAMIIDPHSDEILQEIRVPKRVALEIIDYSRENHLALNVYMDQYTFYTENPNEYSVLDAQLNEVDLQLVEDIKRIVTKDPLKLMFVGEPQLISNLELLFASKDNSYSATTSLPQFLEIVGKKATKKDAL
ncbi:MAG: HAD hydrolase family protein, partial [bacterium]